jgi:NADH-quinone oxidoreductase subunit A
MILSSFFIQESFFILIFLCVSIFLSVIIFGLSYILALHKPDTEKLSPYECGFDPYEDARQAFDVRFYLVSILFIVFDLEAMYLFPWVVSLNQIGLVGFWTMIDFIVELGIGLIYAWRTGSFEWE